MYSASFADSKGPLLIKTTEAKTGCCTCSSVLGKSLIILGIAGLALGGLAIAGYFLPHVNVLGKIGNTFGLLGVYISLAGGLVIIHIGIVIQCCDSSRKKDDFQTSLQLSPSPKPEIHQPEKSRDDFLDLKLKTSKESISRPATPEEELLNKQKKIKLLLQTRPPSSEIPLSQSWNGKQRPGDAPTFYMKMPKVPDNRVKSDPTPVVLQRNDSSSKRPATSPASLRFQQDMKKHQQSQ